MRKAYLTGFLACCGLLAYAYYLQHVAYLDPCPLCIFQRLAFMGMGMLFLIGGIHDPSGWGGRSYAMLVSLFGVLGAALAARHIYLQNLPPDQVPECGPGLSYLMDTLPMTEVLAKVLSGSGECAEIAWRFLGLSMPWWTLIWYVGLIAWAMAFGWKSTRRHIFLD